MMILLNGPRVLGGKGSKKMYSDTDEKSMYEKVAYSLGIPSVHLNVTSKENAGPGLSPTMASPPRASRSHGTVKSSPGSSRLASTDRISVVERSPNSRAKCRQCKHTIEKQSIRVGVTKMKGNGYTNTYFYHQKCISNDPSTASRIKAELQRKDEEAASTTRLIYERAELRELLRKLRQIFAHRLDVEPYKIFDNKTLDGIVLKMPRTRGELLACNGIREKRYANFGYPILQIIALYRMSQTRRSGSSVSPQKSMIHAQVSAVSEEDDEVVVTETLTSEQIVAQRFREAEAKGEMISL
jgi:hypothetical protein